MNKALKALSIFLYLSVITIGCIRDDLDGCPKVRLTFSYLADGKINVISDYLHSAVLHVFNEEGKCVTSLDVSKEQISAPGGMLVDLKPGAYTLVCWGNNFDDTEISLSDLSNSTLQSPHYTLGNYIPTNDALYHAALPFTVAEEQSASGNLDFRSAHIKFNIYVKGGNGLPVIALHHLFPQYDFGMNPVEKETVTYLPAVIKDSNENLYVATLRTLRFGDDNPVEIELRNSEGTTLATESLADFMARQNPPITVEDKQEVTLNIAFEITSLGVNITVPDWTTETVTPQSDNNK